MLNFINDFFVIKIFEKLLEIPQLPEYKAEKPSFENEDEYDEEEKDSDFDKPEYDDMEDEIKMKRQMKNLEDDEEDEAKKVVRKKESCSRFRAQFS